MNGEERYNVFISNLENWISSNGIAKIDCNPEVEKTLNMRQADLRKLTHNECLELSYELYAYSEYLDSILAQQQTVLVWADDSIWYIISDKVDQYGSKYTKWQEKYFRAVKENPLASEIIRVKNMAAARVKILENKISTVKKLSDILFSLSKRK